MNEKKAKQLRDILRNTSRQRDWLFAVESYNEKQMRRAMQEIGEPTTGTDVLQSVVYATNVTKKVKGVAKQRSNKDGTRSKRENVAYSIALTQLHGRARIPRSLCRMDDLGNLITGRERLREIVKESLYAGETGL